MMTKLPKTSSPPATKCTPYRGGPFGAPAKVTHAKGTAQASMGSYKRGGKAPK